MDEFSDFQMAVQKPSPSVSLGVPYKNGVSSGKLPGSLRFPDSSPVHSLSHSTNPKADLVRSHAPALLLPPVMAPVQKLGTKSVGSRLANYDLGLSVPTTPSNGLNNGGCPSNLVNVMGLSSSTPKTINLNPIRNNNQDLLIGEEDKYSALRMLIETDVDSTTSVFQNSKPVQASEAQMQPPHSTPAQLQLHPSQNTTIITSGSNATPTTVPLANNINHTNLVLGQVHVLNHSSSFVNSNLTSALQLSTKAADQQQPAPVGSVDSSSDFGDFQSFTGFTPQGSKHNGVQPHAPEFHQSSRKFDFDGIMDQFQSAPQNQSTLTPAPALPSLQKQELCGGKSDIYENGTCDSDGEFGDFVSVEPSSNRQAHAQAPLSVAAPPPPASNWNHGNIDLASSLSTSSPPPKDEDKRIENGTNTHCADNQPVQKKDIYQSPTELRGQKFSDEDFNNIVLGQGLDWESSAVGMDSMKPATPQNTFLPSFNSTSFIRTSLIRNDEVTDIDPLKWNSVGDEPVPDGALDFSLERKDFSSIGGKSKFLDISPETRSIASLDLGSYVTVDYPETAAAGNNNNNSKPFIDQPIFLQQHQNYPKSSAVTASSAPLMHGIMSPEEPIAYDEYDKYQCFRLENDSEKERYCAEWSRCLDACKTLISKAFSVFSSVSTSEVIREVVSDDKGYTYVINIFEIYRISRRIQKSAEKVGIGTKVRNVCVEITNLWETLAAFLLGTCVSPEICQDSYEDDIIESHEMRPSCGVCLCDVNISQSSQFLDYGGQFYHCKCANFWVNEVDAILPSLSQVPNVVHGDVAIAPAAGFSNHAGSHHYQHQVACKFEKNNLM